MDVVYILQNSPNGNFEIRHSLRSLAENAPFVRKVWILGDRPDFLTNDTSIVEHVPHAAYAGVLDLRVPIINHFLLMVISALLPESTSEYLFFCDDYYVMREFTEENARKDRYLEDMTKQPLRGRGLWVDGLWRTFDVLQRLGFSGYNFEHHIPLYLTKKRVLRAYADFRDFITEDRWYGLYGQSVVLNHAYKHEQMAMVNLLEENIRLGYWGSPPSYDQVKAEIEGKLFFNFDDLAFGDGIRNYLAERFPNPSKYEL